MKTQEVNTMRRRKRSHFPMILLLCLLCLLLLGIRQGLFSADSSFSLSAILQPNSSEDTQPSTVTEDSALTSDSLLSETASSLSDTSAASEKKDTVSSAVPEQDTDDCYAYYYQQLPDAQQRLYRQLYSCVSSRKDNVTLSVTDSDTVHKVYHFVLYDHPGLFWCTGSSKSQVYTDKIEFMPEYSLTPEEISMRQKEIEEQTELCLSEISASASDYEKVRYIYTWLITTVNYDEHASDNQNIYSSLVGHASVCAGYAKGMQFLLNRLSVPCIYLTGTLKNGGSHAWNLVCCDDTWYQTDVTFGDPVFTNTEDVPKDNLSFAYLCCTDAQIRGSHTPDNEVSYPACTSMKLNYYAQNGWFMWVCDETDLTNRITAAIDNGENGFTLQCANSEIYKEVCSLLLDTVIPKVSQTYMEAHGLQKVNYKYSKDADMLIFSLYWGSD